MLFLGKIRIDNIKTVIFISMKFRNVLFLVTALPYGRGSYYKTPVRKNTLCKKYFCTKYFRWGHRRAFFLGVHFPGFSRRVFLSPTLPSSVDRRYPISIFIWSFFFWKSRNALGSALKRCGRTGQARQKRKR